MALSLLDFDTAYLVWFVIIELLVVINLIHLKSFMIRDDEFLIAFCMTLFFTPLYVELFMGQYSMIQATFILFLFTCLYNKNPRNAFHFWGASALWKLNTFLALPVFMKYRENKPVYWTIGIALASLIIYWIIIGNNVFNFFLINFRVPSIYQEGNLGLRMLWDSVILHVFHLGHPVNDATGNISTYELSLGGKLLSLILPAMVLVGCFHALVNAQKGKFIDLVALWITAYFLLYTDIWEHHYLMLLPILITQYARKRWPLILICYLFIALPTPFALLENLPVIYIPSVDGTPSVWSVILYHAVKPIPTLIFFIAMWRYIVTWKPEYDELPLGSDWSDKVGRQLR